ncbi:MAG: aa3-type cytochrome c oxidase subunit IV [Sneathiella sp.]|nr:aa3-type cytochrome c oxidase subunit IV [Sneathiella sp.]
MNIKQQNGSYVSFVKMTTYVTVFLAILLAIMAATLV